MIRLVGDGDGDGDDSDDGDGDCRHVPIGCQRGIKTPNLRRNERNIQTSI